MIREFQTADTEQVMQIWLNGNEDAHPFISKKYWCSNFSMVQEQLLQAEVFVYEKDGIIRGFIGITDGYIAGIFVDRKCRSCDCDKHKRVERYATTCRKAESDNYLLKISGSSRFRRNPQRG